MGVVVPLQATRKGQRVEGAFMISGTEGPNNPFNFVVLIGPSGSRGHVLGSDYAGSFLVKPAKFEGFT